MRFLCNTLLISVKPCPNAKGSSRARLPLLAEHDEYSTKICSHMGPPHEGVDAFPRRDGCVRWQTSSDNIRMGRRAARGRMSLHVVNDCRIPPRFCDCPHLGGGGGNWNTVNPICHPIRRADEASPILRLSRRKTSSADLTASQACPSQNKRDGRHIH